MKKVELPIGDQIIVKEIQNIWLKNMKLVRSDWLNRHNNKAICEVCGKELDEKNVREWHMHNKIHRKIVDKEFPSKDAICVCYSCHKIQIERYERPDGSIIEYEKM